MSVAGIFFEDYDDADVYARIQIDLLSDKARNFVVDFGQDGAMIAFNVDSNLFELLFKGDGLPRPEVRPVRWINIWGPDTQPGLIDIISDHYGFSHRFHAILKKAPPAKSKEDTLARGGPLAIKGSPVNDVEHAVAEKIPLVPTEGRNEINHYSIAKNLINFQSLDLGEKFICIGANWLYHLKKEEIRLWSWLILCDDSTVISLHEDPKPDDADEKYMEAIRAHVMNILNQLSSNDADNGGSISLTSIRKILKSDPNKNGHGSEGSSNLFYYLFDNWVHGYEMIISNQERLKKLSKMILSGLEGKHQKPLDKGIIPGLYEISKQLRTNQHLYQGYWNIIERILKYKAGAMTQSGKRVAVALTASERFERLGDRIKLLVLSSIDEAIAEKDALLNTYFQITTQKDSAATAKLSRNATLLSKLGVLFLPVGLLTSYFSTQIPDLQSTFTSENYWISFAVIMTLSFVALFFLSRVLVSITESLESRVHNVSRWCKKHFGQKAFKVE